VSFDLYRPDEAGADTGIERGEAVIAMVFLVAFAAVKAERRKAMALVAKNAS
jgi:hypothetical protein